MKRSEIVSLINNQIEGYMNPSSSRYTAEKILRTIEEAGMLPPTHAILHEGSSFDEDGEELINGSFSNEWESE